MNHMINTENTKSDVEEVLKVVEQVLNEVEEMPIDVKQEVNDVEEVVEPWDYDANFERHTVFAKRKDGANNEILRVEIRRRVDGDEDVVFVKRRPRLGHVIAAVAISLLVAVIPLWLALRGG